MKNLAKSLLLSGSTITLVSAMAFSVAVAQPATPGSAAGVTPAEIETIQVSTSRINIQGYVAPTPVTVIGAEALETEAKMDIGDAIRTLPSVGGASPQAGSGAQVISGAPAGQSNLTLRGLGNLRTLVLIDGQRIVNSNITGGVDLNTLPSSLVERVDVVTGGASAAWGSDAVAGVVNLIINKNYTGFKAHAEFSDNSSDTYRGMKIEAAYGTSFAGDRGHTIISAAYVNSPDTVYTTDVKYYKKTQLVPNPANPAQLIRKDNIGNATATPGGLIISNPAGTVAGSANILANTMFVGPSATPVRINRGNIVGPAAWGGDLNFSNSMTPIVAVALPYRTTTVFSHTSFQIFPELKATLQLNYGKAFAQNTGQASFRLGNLTIRSDNPYIPQQTRDVMTANGIPSFVMGTLNTNNVNLLDFTPREASTSLGIPVNNNYRQQMRAVFSLEGSLGNDWAWDAYVQHGVTRVALRVISISLTQRFSDAADVVTVTAANRGTSGLSLGSIVCRTTLANPSNGCQPLNVFGEGVASPNAIAWINSYDNINRQDITMNQSVGAFSLQGVLPWGFPAGEIAIATGAEYRKEGARTVADPRANAALWAGGNFADFAGQYHVEEGFLEVEVPVLKDSFVESLNVNAAGRMTNYSTSGLVETWKLGVNSQVNTDLRLRSTWSVDIRAPNLSELFRTAQVNTGSQVDLNSPACTAPIGANGFPTSTAGCTSVQTFNVGGGNRNLVPEVANTVTAGIVFTPSFLDGLMMSLDWYSIDIKKSIVSLGGNPIQCAAGLQEYCNLLEFAGPTYSNGKRALSTVRSVPVNAASESTSGFDMQIDYLTPFLDGDLRLRFVGNYNDQRTTVNAGTTCNAAGMAGIGAACSGEPKFKGTVSVGYNEGPLSVTAQSRFQSAWRLNSAWTSGVQVDNNELPWNAYLDLRASYRWGENVQFYTAVDNVLGTPAYVVPPLASAGSSYQSLGLSGDTLGRVLRAGVRLSY